jgi:hypothetical protein
MMIVEEVTVLRTVIEMVVAAADSEAVADVVGMEAIVEVVEDTAVVIVAHMGETVEETVVDMAEDVEDMEVAEKCVVVPDHLNPALLQVLPTVSMLVTWSSMLLPRISRSCSRNLEPSPRSLSLLMPEV